MAIVPSGFVNQSQVRAAVGTAQDALSQYVVRIRYDFGEDWSGESAIFFRVLLRDEASKPEELGMVSSKVISKLNELVQPEDFGLLSYFNFRSESEQKAIKEASWA